MCIEYLFDNADNFIPTCFSPPLDLSSLHKKNNKGLDKTQHISNRPTLSESYRRSFNILSKSHTYRSVRFGLRFFPVFLRL